MTKKIVVVILSIVAAIAVLIAIGIVLVINRINHYFDPKTIDLHSSSIDPDAVDLLKAVQTRMFSLDTYQAECWTSLKYQAAASGKIRLPRYQMATLVVAKSVKPYRMLKHYDQWDMVLCIGKNGKPDETLPWRRKSDLPHDTYVCDGHTEWDQFGSTYRVNDPNLGTGMEPWGGFFDPQDSPYGWLSAVPTHNDQILAVRRVGKEVVEGVLCDKVFTRVNEHYGGDEMELSTYWYIGNDSLVHRQVETVREDNATSTTDAILRHIQINQPVTNRAALFSYTPPPGVKREVPAKEIPLLPVGTVAPDFTATDVDGKPVSLSRFRGKVVVLDFWSTWCGPCIEAMPYNQALATKFQNEKQPIVWLTIDNGDSRATFLRWVRRHGKFSALTFTYIDPKPDDVSHKAYRVSGVPTLYVIDAQGKIQASSTGFDSTSDTSEKAIRAALKTH